MMLSRQNTSTRFLQSTAENSLQLKKNNEQSPSNMDHLISLHQSVGNKTFECFLKHGLIQTKIKANNNGNILDQKNNYGRSSDLLGQLQTFVPRSGISLINRQCDPTWAGLDWSDRVANVNSMSNGTARDQCMKDMIDEALYPNVTVHESTNTLPSTNIALNAGRYTEWNSLSDLHINFDRNLSAKTGNPNQYGHATFQLSPSGDSIDIFIILGPNALNPVGPQHTRMAFDHESEHAWDYIMQFAIRGAGPPHSATAGEELSIYTEGFSMYFLDLWTIDNSVGTYRISDTFPSLFTNYVSATTVERNDSFESIERFYDVRIRSIPCNMMKFKIWLQMMQNARPSSDALVNRINGLLGLGLTRGTADSSHFNPSLSCS